MKKTRAFYASALCAGALALGGCVVSGSVAVPLGPPVIVAHGHVHSAHCGHYKHRGRWYHASHHHHGPGCGHTLRGGVWMLRCCAEAILSGRMAVLLQPRRARNRSSPRSIRVRRPRRRRPASAATTVRPPPREQRRQTSTQAPESQARRGRSLGAGRARAHEVGEHRRARGSRCAAGRDSGAGRHRLGHRRVAELADDDVGGGDEVGVVDRRVVRQEVEVAVVLLLARAAGHHEVVAARRAQSLEVRVAPLDAAHRDQHQRTARLRRRQPEPRAHRRRRRSRPPRDRRHVDRRRQPQLDPATASRRSKAKTLHLKASSGARWRREAPAGGAFDARKASIEGGDRRALARKAPASRRVARSRGRLEVAVGLAAEAEVGEGEEVAHLPHPRREARLARHERLVDPIPGEALDQDRRQPRLSRDEKSQGRDVADHRRGTGVADLGDQPP
jgi:hypothetical protein